MAEYFQSKGITDIGPTATLHDHVQRDVARIEVLMDAAIGGNSAAAFVSLMKIKYVVLERAGLLEDLTVPLSGSDAAETDSRGRIIARMKRQDVLARFAGQLFDKAAGVTGMEQPRIRTRLRSTFAGIDTPESEASEP